MCAKLCRLLNVSCIHVCEKTIDQTIYPIYYIGIVNYYHYANAMLNVPIVVSYTSYSNVNT